jgi:hypothetical protein
MRIGRGANDAIDQRFGIRPWPFSGAFWLASALQRHTLGFTVKKKIPIGQSHE